jgi:tetratricopeptide (TPR) repeat protein
MSTTVFKSICFLRAIYFTAVLALTIPRPLTLYAQESVRVFKIFAANKDRPTVPLEGSAFVVASEGNSSNPTLYFLTAAHVILGPEGTDDTKISDVLDKLQVRFGAAEGDVWNVNLNTIRIPIHWESEGRDFALFRVGNTGNAGRDIKACKLVTTRPDDKHFLVEGFPAGVSTLIQMNGTLLTDAAGDASDAPWYVVDAQIAPGMSGGPALSTEGVFAIVQGRHQTAEQLKLLVPIALAGNFLRDNIVSFAKPFGYNDQNHEDIDKTYWETIKSSTDPDDFASYLKKYPQGEFSDLAKIRFDEALTQLVEQARTAYNQQKWADAERLYKKAEGLGTGSSDVGFHVNYGIALYSQSKFAAAGDEFEKAVVLDPKNPLWYYNRGLTELNLAKWADYEATQKKLTELEPTNAGKYRDLGFAQLKLGKWDEAQQSLNRAIALNPNDAGYRDLLQKAKLHAPP